MNQKRIRGLIGLMIVLQLVAMLTKAQEWAVVQRIDRKTSEHTIVLASHSTKLDAILDFGLSHETKQKLKEYHGNP
jgi:hypothetical protein